MQVAAPGQRPPHSRANTPQKAGCCGVAQLLRISGVGWRAAWNTAPEMIRWPSLSLCWLGQRVGVHASVNPPTPPQTTPTELARWLVQRQTCRHGARPVAPCGCRPGPVGRKRIQYGGAAGPAPCNRPGLFPAGRRVASVVSRLMSGRRSARGGRAGVAPTVGGSAQQAPPCCMVPSFCGSPWRQPMSPSGSPWCEDPSTRSDAVCGSNV